MRVSNVKIGHVYYVDYEPTRTGEFSGIHLSVILKRNSNHTFNVMPLTSVSKGNGLDTKEVGCITALPADTRNTVSYAVYSQIRTVSATRIIEVKDSGKYVVVPLDNSLFLNLFECAIQDIVYNIKQEEKIVVIKKVYDNVRFIKAKDLAYDIIRLRNAGVDDEKVAAMKEEICSLLTDVTYELDAKQSADGIQAVFNDAINP